MNFWVLNTNPNHWEICLNGPKNREIHGDNVGHPWHGLPENSRPRRPPYDLNPGDVFLVRQTQKEGAKSGVKAVWVYHSSSKVKSQENVPKEWRRHEKGLRNYQWFIYCRESTRELKSIYKENWGELEINHVKFTGTIIRLSDKEKRRYIKELLNHGGLEKETVKLFQKEIQNYR